ncbi:sigma-54-dependent Fis family transcriptional regulator [Marinitoga sp. 1155]|uniref:sigma-54-dependent Fis family transcriptional regulator n=1 Tax=Marinitoga sp. 1155 TaxID=1428448 RepID=UPI00065962D0|nr:sigma-54-dependent Fis family transcriptional regulator [Marinitoga sp. 1155]KLO21742.1 ATPase AAA [Marinitoga sp. 1155]
MKNDEMIMRILDDIQEAVILINHEEKIIFLNNSASKILGIPKKKALNTKVTDTITDTRLHIVLKTGIPELDRIQNLGKKVIVTSRFPIRDEEDIIIGAAAIFRDITSIQKLAEEVTNLRELDSLLRAIIDSTYDAISVADEEGRIVMVNKAYTKVTGLTPKEVIGKLATYDIAEGHESMHIKCAREKQPILNVKTKLSTNKKEVLINVNPIFVKGEFKGSVGVIHDISEIERLIRELEATKRLLKKEEAKYTFEDIVAESEIMKNVVFQSKKAANTNVNILLYGEAGVGKEILAQAIHNYSKRREFPFLSTNLLLQDEKKQLENFFENEDNLIERAEKGTIFIDNAHLMGPEVQNLMIKLLNDGEVFYKNKKVSLNAKIIFATPENLKELMSIGKFSRKLYYKISVVTIEVPALRERKEDIPKMAKQILHILNQKHEKVVYDFSEDAVKILESYEWPGNIRELENVLDRALMNMSQSDTIITSMHLPELKTIELDKNKINGTLKELLDEYEKYIIIETLKDCQGNKTAAARKLGLTVRNLYYKLEKLGLK